MHPKIKSLGDYDKYTNMLIVAHPGFGKTVLAGTAPNALFLTTDPEGTVSAMAMGSTAKEWKIESWDELVEAYQYLANGGIQEMGLEWVIIDNISEAQLMARQASMDGRRAKNTNLDEFVPDQMDYQRSQNMLTTFVKRFNDLPVNMLWTSWSLQNENDDGETYFTPAIHGQKGHLAQQIAGYMNVVGYGEVRRSKEDKTVRRFWFAGTQKFQGKDRFNALGRFIDDPDMPKIIQQIEKQKKLLGRTTTTLKKPSSATSPLKRKAPVRRTTK